MTTKDEPSASEGRADSQDEKRNVRSQEEQGEKRNARSQMGEGVHTEDAGKPEPGTHGPEGPLDDQPQREDEYLSEMLNEFNPQRKDAEEPSDDADTSRKGRSSRSRDTS